MCIYHELNDEQQRTIRTLFVSQPRSDILWSDVLVLLEVLTKLLGGEVQHGSEWLQIAIGYGEQAKIAILPCPDSQITISPPVVASIQEFLSVVGVEPG